MEEVKVDMSYSPKISSDEVEISKMMEERFFKSSNNFLLPYRIYVPENYNKEYKYPLVVFFHGAGESGNDNLAQLGKRFVFLYRILNRENLVKYPCIVIAPQCTKEDCWVKTAEYGVHYDTNKVPQTKSLYAFIELIEELKKNYSIDIDRIYLTGLSMGGGATIDTIARYPLEFACGIAMCPNIDMLNDVDKFKYANLWEFHGIVDNVCLYDRSKDMIDSIKKKGYYAHLTTYPSANHGECWTWGYNNKMLLDYMFESRRGKINKYLLNDEFVYDEYEHVYLDKK